MSKSKVLLNKNNQYILDNIDAVIALNEMFDNFRNEFPEYLCNAVYNNLKTKFSDIKAIGWEPSDEYTEEVRIINNKYWDEDNGTGQYFAIYSFNWKEITADNNESGIAISLYSEFKKSNKMKKTHNEIISNIKNSNNIEDDYHINTDISGGNIDYVTLYLNNLINVNTLNNESLIEEIVDEFIKFFQNTKNILENTTSDE